MKPGEATRQIYSTGIKSISELACDFSLLQQAVVLPLFAKASVLGGHMPVQARAATSACPAILIVISPQP